MKSAGAFEAWGPVQAFVTGSLFFHVYLGGAGFGAGNDTSRQNITAFLFPQRNGPSHFQLDKSTFQCQGHPCFFFQRCVLESKKDPAYKVFVILMQPVKTLKGYTAYMDRYFRSKTYLTKDDPDLLTKLAGYIRVLRDEEANNAEERGEV